MESSNLTSLDTSLFDECCERAPDAAKIKNLLEKGARANVLHSASGSCPLHAICKNYRNSREKINGGGNSDPIRDQIIEDLLSHGAAIDAKDRNGATPLQRACQDGNVALLEVLLRHKADANACDDKGETPLHVVSRRDKSLCLELLLAHGAKISAVDRFGRSALHHACAWSKPECVQLLLREGAPIDTPDKDGLTPLHLAVDATTTYEHFPESLLSCDVVVYLLHEMGADTTARDNLGRTPSDFDLRQRYSVLFKMAVAPGRSVGLGPWCRALFFLRNQYYLVFSVFPRPHLWPRSLGALQSSLHTGHAPPPLSVAMLRAWESQVRYPLELTVYRLGTKSEPELVKVSELPFSEDFKVIVNILDQPMPTSSHAMNLLVYYYTDDKLQPFDFKDPKIFCKAFLDLRSLRPEISLQVLLQKEYFRMLDTGAYKPTEDELEKLRHLDNVLGEKRMQKPRQKEIIKYVNRCPYDTENPARSVSRRIESFAREKKDGNQTHADVLEAKVVAIGHSVIIKVIQPKGRDRLEQKISEALRFIPGLPIDNVVADLKDIFRGSVCLEEVSDDFIEVVRPHVFQSKLKDDPGEYCALYLLLNIDDFSFELQVIPRSIQAVRGTAHAWYSLLRAPVLDNLYIFLDQGCRHKPVNDEPTANQPTSDEVAEGEPPKKKSKQEETFG